MRPILFIAYPGADVGLPFAGITQLVFTQYIGRQYSLAERIGYDYRDAYKLKNSKTYDHSAKIYNGYGRAVYAVKERREQSAYKRNHY